MRKFKAMLILPALLVSGFAMADGYIDSHAGVIVDDSGLAALDLQGPPSGDCTLVVPAVVARGQTFIATVEYDPPAPGGARREDFGFEWSSVCPGFSQKTDRQKAWEDIFPGVVGSFLYVTAPTLTCIEGPVDAQVKVRGDYKCKA
ncbi:MAG: hypothetical protein R3348_07950, partial [Xanthomonadales bacterium]|nr:hypothetical protein [Xanthomonadales bacterium]